MKDETKEESMGEVSIPFQRVEGLFLQEAIGEAEFGGETAQIGHLIPCRSVLIQFRGSYYLVRLSDIVEAVLLRASD